MKLQLLALFALLSTGLLTAQASWGIRAGAGQTALRSGQIFDPLTDRLEPLGNISLGAFAELPLTGYIAFRPGLEYSSRGSSLGLTDKVEVFGVQLPVGARAKTRFNYIEAPLLVQVNLPTESAIQPYAIAGPTLGYATGGRVTTAARAVVELNLYGTDLDLDAIGYERFHVGVIGGLGARARLGENTGLFMEARYEHGLSQPYDVPVIRDKVGFRGWNVGAGVTFAL
ncbi:porin family protein [Neolewinella litorea]|uniref:PorT family protein n=1 Tax=Neolewinella litorea TaxID=2562452 RepID=A0A4S4NNT2_9BACT|nr:porin family protein [Neolewinella litorea]THH40028.1 PorT family protein [Neolewinella litorea]